MDSRVQVRSPELGHSRKLGPETGSEVRSGSYKALRAFLFQVSVTLRTQASKAGLMNQRPELQRSRPEATSVLETRVEF